MKHYVLDARTATPHFPGIGRYVANLARALPPLLASDERLTLLTAPDFSPSLHPVGQGGPAGQGSPGRGDPAPAATRTLAVSPFALSQQWVVPRLLRQIHADVYHSAYYLMPYRPGVPTLVTLYDLIPILFPQHSTARARLLFRAATTLALANERLILTISEATTRDLLARFHIDPARVRAIPLAADPNFQPQPPSVLADLRRRYDLPNHYVLYLGSNKPHKNLKRLIEAFAHLLPEARETPPLLIIAGAWDPRYPEAQEQARALALASRVRFLGPVPEADLPALYAAADLFVFPSLYEGFGLPVLEAMACGAPVACSRTSSLPEVAGNAALLFDPIDPAGIAAAIENVWSDADLQANLRRRSLEQAARFSWQRTAQATLAAYRDEVMK